jgi:hypothetical protein
MGKVDGAAMKVEKSIEGFPYQFAFSRFSLFPFFTGFFAWFHAKLRRKSMKASLGLACQESIDPVFCPAEWK